MALTWTPKMGNASRTPELEQLTREAIFAACSFYGTAFTGELPRFNGGNFVNAVNDNARAMEAECLKHLPADLTGVQRGTILTTAVRTAEVWFHAGPDGGQAAVEALFPARPATTVRRPEPASATEPGTD